MANEGKIYIIVTDQLPNGQGTLSPDKPADKKDKESSLEDFARHKFFNFIEGQAKQMVNYTVSNIGNFTGDYIKQQQISGAVSLVSFGAELVTAAMAGSKYGYGGIAVSVGLVVATKAISTGEQLLSQFAETGRQNRAIEQLRTRAGLNGTNNGSRGTDQ